MSHLDELTLIHSSSVSTAERYRALSAFFHRFINAATASKGIEFRGPFAKTDYLLKEFKADRYLIRIVNNARVRFRHLSSLSEKEREIHYGDDLEAVARLVSIVENNEIPTALSSSFIHEKRTKNEMPLAGEYLRFIVDDFDDRYIFVTSDLHPDRQLRIDYITPNTFYPSDNSYLRDILYKGAQLNAIRPRISDDTVYPELIIFEPDQLIDVSAVAGCFESYGTDPRIALLKRISPPPAGDAVNLGNFAGQLLDEEIHSSASPRPYAQSTMDFFRNNALPLSAIPPQPDFHQQAKSQQQNIHNALHQDLPGAFAEFDVSNLMVEPSFFSEMLGLQGRMDLIQLDLRILAEQKSGKGEWPYDDFKVPRHREQHYVQLLLYMLIIRYNYRLRYEANNRELNPFLLYSKYEKSLVALGFAPRLVAEAIRIRNLIAALDISYSEKGVGHLADLSPDDLNKKGSSPLWDRFSRPALAALLAPIKTVSPLDRAYYMRFMRFIAKEHLLAKIGNRRKENSGFAATWQSPLEEKIDSGNIYIGLTLLNDFPPEGKIEDLTLLFTDDGRNSMANFRRGDVVILYSYPEGSEPDGRRNMVFRASIESIMADRIRLHLRAPQSSSKAFFARFIPSEKPLLWAIEHDFMEASFTGLYRATHSFLTAPRERRDLLMLRRRPRKENSISLNLDHGAFNPLALAAKQARDLFLIVGPPGTGKTSFGLMTSLREELSEKNSNVVILAFTNRAVDEICSKLAADGIDYIRLGSELSCTSPKENLLCNRIEGCRSISDLQNVIAATRVFVATTTALNAAPLLFRLKKFSLSIIDEASQILEPHILGLLSATAPDGSPAIERFIMIGDHKQLPAVVQQTQEDSLVDEPSLREIGLTDCSLSLFERLLRRYGNDEDICRMLTSQGRMHVDIADYPNKCYYGGVLSAVPLPHQVSSLPDTHTSARSLRQIIASSRVAFFDVRPKEHSLSDKINQEEAELIARIVASVHDINKGSFDPDRTIGVIVPYRNQIAAIRNRLAATGIPNLDAITIDTIERYQGSQRRYIVYGFTVSRPYQLDFLSNQCFMEGDALIDRKLNVAMTRAEEHLLLVGNAPLLKQNMSFSNLLGYLERRNAIFDFTSISNKN